MDKKRNLCGVDGVVSVHAEERDYPRRSHVLVLNKSLIVSERTDQKHIFYVNVFIKYGILDKSICIYLDCISDKLFRKICNLDRK